MVAESMIPGDLVAHDFLLSCGLDGEGVCDSEMKKEMKNRSTMWHLTICIPLCFALCLLVPVQVRFMEYIIKYTAFVSFKDPTGI